MMGRLIRHRLVQPSGPRTTVTVTVARGVTPALRGVAGCSAFLMLAIGAQARILLPPSGGSASALAMSAAEAAREAGSFRQIILPDLLVVAPSGLTEHHLAGLRKIPGPSTLISFHRPH